MKEKFSVGLDIGTSSVKLVKIKTSAQGIELCSFNLEPLKDDLSSQLKQICQPQGISRVNIGISGSSSIIRYAAFPSLNPEELKQALKFEGQKHIPFPLAEVYLDGCILKKDLPDNKMLVLLAAVKQDFIQKRLKALEDAGLKPDTIDMDSLALVNAFNYNYAHDEEIKTKTIALINIGCMSTNLNILEGGLPRLSRDIYVAGNHLTQKIQDSFALDFKAAEALKINPDKEQAEKISKIAQGIFMSLSSEIRVSFDYYESQSASSVAEIYLSGGACLFPGLEELISGMLGIKARIWDPLNQVKIGAGLDAEKIKSLSVQLAVSTGLGLRS